MVIMAGAWRSLRTPYLTLTRAQAGISKEGLKIEVVVNVVLPQGQLDSTSCSSADVQTMTHIGPLFPYCQDPENFRKMDPSSIATIALL
jgi:hypothetical protein